MMSLPSRFRYPRKRRRYRRVEFHVELLFDALLRSRKRVVDDLSRLFALHVDKDSETSLFLVKYQTFIVSPPGRIGGNIFVAEYRSCFGSGIAGGGYRVGTAVSRFVSAAAGPPAEISRKPADRKGRQAFKESIRNYPCCI